MDGMRLLYFMRTQQMRDFYFFKKKKEKSSGLD